MQSALVAKDLVKAYGPRHVLDGVTLVAAPGRRIGVVGENGAGKSTLLRLLAGVEEPDGGAVERPRDLAYLPQEPAFPPAATAGDVLDDALRGPKEAVAAVDRLAQAIAARPDDDALLNEYAGALTRAEDAQAWDADRRAEVALAALGLEGLDRGRRLATLSGGQRSRLALAALLVRRPEALLLDEPTNHLDDDAAAFVEDQLRRLPGAVVAASHDRAFLDAACTDLIDLDPAVGATPTRYGGAYTEYVEARRAERARWEQRYAEEQAELEALRHAVAVGSRRVAPHNRPPRDNDKFIHHFSGERVQKTISRRVHDAQRRLDQLTRDQVRKPPPALRFRARLGAGGDAPAAVLRDVVVPGRLHLDHLDVGAADRLLVSGPNGAGKSTLLAVLAGGLAPAQGQVHRRRGLRLGYLAQDSTVARDGRRTARAIYTEAVGQERADQVPLTTLGLLQPRDLDRPVGELSVGQQRRLELAVLVAVAPHLLLLDEPTNHLSPSLSDELEEALGTGPGAVVVASHDRWLRGRWEGRTLALDQGRALSPARRGP